jgi:hypothetical protein
MADRLEDLARRRARRQLGQQLVDRAESDDQVVSVVAVAQDRVEPGQVSRVASDDPAAAREPRAQRDRVERHIRPGVDENDGIGR